MVVMAAGLGEHASAVVKKKATMASMVRSEDPRAVVVRSLL
jgi:hypothetical protein